MCPGGQINMTCQATLNETLLQWSLMIPGRSVPELRFITSLGGAQSVTPLTVGQTVFQFFRTSTSPLISRMTISNVSVELNGTRVDCSYGGSVTSTTIFNIIRNGMYRSSNITVLHLYHQPTVSVQPTHAINMSARLI